MIINAFNSNNMILYLFVDYAENIFNTISVGKDVCKEDVDHIIMTKLVGACGVVFKCSNIITLYYYPVV